MWFAVTGVSCDDSLVMSEGPGSNAARVGALLLGKRNTVLVSTLPERGLYLTPAYHPRGNYTERVNRFIGESLRTMLSMPGAKKADW